MVGATTAKLREPKHVRTRGTDSKLVNVTVSKLSTLFGDSETRQPTKDDFTTEL